MSTIALKRLGKRFHALVALSCEVAVCVFLPVLALLFVSILLCSNIGF